MSVRRSTAGAMARLVRSLGRPGRRFEFDAFRMAGVPFRVGARNRIERGRGYDESHRARNLALVREVRRRADVVIFSLHEHQQGPWLYRLARDAIDAGADLVHIHGPHRIQGIEIHRGRPIFYSLGDLVYESNHILRLPAEAYEKVGLGDAATRAELEAVRSGNGTRGLSANPETYLGLAAELDLEDGRVREIRLLPLDLGFGEPDATRGRPRCVDSTRGARIVEVAAVRSRAFGTRIDWDAASACGRVRLSRLT